MELSFHAGELAAQARFNQDWDEAGARWLGHIIRDRLDVETQRFIEGISFFLLATADAEGRCYCSFKSTEPGADGRMLTPVMVDGAKRLLFPDYAGNRMFNSLGNILVNPGVGLLFIDSLPSAGCASTALHRF